jgi:hypothetical protein
MMTAVPRGVTGFVFAVIERVSHIRQAPGEHIPLTVIAKPRPCQIFAVLDCGTRIHRSLLSYIAGIGSNS